MSFIDSILFRKGTDTNYKLMICDDNKTPGEILLDNAYLRKFNPSIESINNNKSLILNLRSEDQIAKLCDYGSKYNNIIQVIKDNSFINGIDGFVYFN